MKNKTELLEKLAFDLTDYTISERHKFAKQGKYLSVLVNDWSWAVRRAVAEQGYGLDKLVNDKKWVVRKTAKEKLNERK